MSAHDPFHTPQQAGAIKEGQKKVQPIKPKYREDSHLPPYEPRPFTVTIGDKIKAKLKYNRLTKFYLTLTRPSLKPNIQWLEFKLTKWHHHALYASVLIGKNSSFNDCC